MFPELQKPQLTNRMNYFLSKTFRQTNFFFDIEITQMRKQPQKAHNHNYKDVVRRGSLENILDNNAWNDQASHTATAKTRMCTNIILLFLRWLALKRFAQNFTT